MKAAFAILVVLAVSSDAAATRFRGCRWRPPLKVTRNFCETPPVAPVVQSSYTGIWYQIYVNRGAQRVSPSGCVTANYTAKPNGIGVLNCFDGGRGRAICLPGMATQPGISPARLRVKFGANDPDGPYNIAALLGDPEYGYYAAAVFSCTIKNGRPRSSWFILARSPYRPIRVLREMKRKLRCKGYNVDGERFFSTKHGNGCNYFFGPKGFNKISVGSAPRGRRTN